MVLTMGGAVFVRENVQRYLSLFVMVCIGVTAQTIASYGQAIPYQVPVRLGYVGHIRLRNTWANHPERGQVDFTSEWVATKRIYRVGLKCGNQRELLFLSKWGVIRALFSPKGHYLALYFSGSLSIIEFSTGRSLKPVRKYEQDANVKNVCFSEDETFLVGQRGEDNGNLERKGRFTAEKFAPYFVRLQDVPWCLQFVQFSKKDLNQLTTRLENANYVGSEQLLSWGRSKVLISRVGLAVSADGSCVSAPIIVSHKNYGGMWDFFSASIQGKWTLSVVQQYHSEGTHQIQRIYKTFLHIVSLKDNTEHKIPWRSSRGILDIRIVAGEVWIKYKSDDNGFEEWERYIIQPGGR